MTDPIADMLARIRNALLARHKTVEMPRSNVNLRIAEILETEGYIQGHSVLETQPSRTVRLELKYDEGGLSVIQGLKRVSKPGSRKYVKAKELPQVRRGLGTAIVSTSKGIMTDHQARTANVGGEVLCTIW